MRSVLSKKSKRAIDDAHVDLSPDHLRLIKKILRDHLPGYEVRAFGSRIGGNAKRHSDLDLVVMTRMPLAMKTLALTKEAFSESDLPFKVDLIDWSLVSEEFKKIIIRQYGVVQESS